MKIPSATLPGLSTGILFFFLLNLLSVLITAQPVVALNKAASVCQSLLFIQITEKYQPLCKVKKVEPFILVSFGLKTRAQPWQTSSKENIIFSPIAPSDFDTSGKQTQPLLLGLFYGVILVMFLYHLLLFFFIREHNGLYLYYALYIAGLGLFQLSYSGLAYEYLWPMASWFANKCVPVFINFTILWGSLFIIRFLATKEYTPQLHRVLKVIAISACVMIPLTFFNSYTPGIIAGMILISAFAIAIWLSAYFSWKKGYRQAKYLFITWNFSLIGILLVSLTSVGLLPATFITVHSLQIGSLLDVVLLSLALANQINVMKEQNEQSRKEIVQAEQSRRFKDQFLANTSHEIRTPMNAIIGFTRLLEQSVLASTQREYVRYIKDSASNLLVIINDILDFSKIESGKITFERVNIHLKELCQSLIETQRFRFVEKNLDVSYYIDEKIPTLFLGDPVRLNQILLNLMSNAIKFTEAGRVHLNVVLRQESDTALIILFEVKDTGIGIPEDKLELIFESFSQASTHTTRKYGGTGLGLTIVKQLVELQGGQIQVTSQVNEGSTFSVIMTFDKGNFNTHSEARNAAVSGAIPANLTILLLEDNPINQILAVNTLQKWLPTIQIDIANNGKEGIAKLQTKDYHLMLVDIQMPEMDGYETTRYIRSQMPFPKNNVPIIALTAGALKDDEERALAAGMNDYISKPFDAEELFSKIRRLQTGKDVHIVISNKFDISNVEKAGLGDPEFMVQLMDMFLERTPEAIRQMQQYANAKDWKQVGFVAHKIKSVFVCMGLAHLQQELLHIEDLAVSQHNLIEIPDMIKLLEKGCGEAYLQIAEERDNLVKK